MGHGPRLRPWKPVRGTPGSVRPSEGVVAYEDANSAFYGIAILNSGREDVTRSCPNGS